MDDRCNLLVREPQTLIQVELKLQVSKVLRVADTNRTPRGRDTHEALAVGEPQETRSGLAGRHKQASEKHQAHGYWVELGDLLWVQNK